MSQLPGEPLEPMEPMQVEMFAASLRANTTDIKAFMEALAAKLQGSLPNQTTVARHSGLFAKEHPVREITVSLGNFMYRITREKQGPVMTQRAKVVRGIVLQTEQIPMEQWINELATSLAEEASSSSQAQAALERFLLQ